MTTQDIVRVIFSCIAIGLLAIGANELNRLDDNEYEIKEDESSHPEEEE